MRILREPLLQFFALGAILFAAFATLHRRESPATAGRTIVITPGMLDNLSLSFQREYGRKPTDAEVREAIDGYVREEILCREAHERKLDLDDATIRAILMERMESLAAEQEGAKPPDEAQLRRFFHEHAEIFRDSDGGLPPLERIRATVASEWRRKQRADSIERTYQTMRQSYRIELPPALNPRPSQP